MILGIIGDDFTGSSDIANNLKKSGMEVSMYAGVPALSPNEAKEQSTEAAVIALKTRTVPIKIAINESLKALKWLKDAGCKQFIFKYCSKPSIYQFCISSLKGHVSSLKEHV